MNESEDFKAGRAYERGLWRRALQIATTERLVAGYGYSDWWPVKPSASPYLGALSSGAVGVQSKLSDVQWTSVCLAYAELEKEAQV